MLYITKLINKRLKLKNNIPSFFFVGSLGLVLLVVVLGGAFSDSWNSMATDGVMGVQVARLPITDIIMSHFGLYSLFVVMIILAGTYIKSTSGGVSY